MSASLQPLADFVRDIQARSGASGSALVLLRRGETLLERYHGWDRFGPGARPIGPQSRFNVYSVRKTYIGLAVALAIHEGLIEGLDAPVGPFLPALDQSLLAGVTVRHLVTRTSGLKGTPDDLRRVFAPGTDWQGTNPGLSLLCRLLERATGQTVAQYLTDRVLKPTGLCETGWETETRQHLVPDSYGPDKPCSYRFEPADGAERNLYVSARDLARWGQLHLDRGAGVVPEEAVRMATTVQSPATLPPRKPRHGLYWWVAGDRAPESELGDGVPPGSYQVLGASNCACLVIPSQQVVAVQMFNSLAAPPVHDWLADIRQFGNLIASAFAAPLGD